MKIYIMEMENYTIQMKIYKIQMGNYTIQTKVYTIQMEKIEHCNVRHAILFYICDIHDFLYQTSIFDE